ncbi:transcriptional regulator [Ancylothrix sp. C2]|uniref:helix-turn-helix transcriptional regulator n=1 Tax=Ancylothrix sp. D3o TaxID=2953691 RepID=UPI0021BA5FF9|nr:metalloregulator ArsR/SmtB family transcription factor [Ancylothrix sp. D3o]MCT7950489.1 transcriptional regulator [Ancylothrix sp. D3o]
MDDKQKAKSQILRLLKMQGAQTATALAEHLQVTPMAVRQHLQVLQAEHWVTYEEERRPQGRPVKLWQLTEECRHFFPDSHGDLMVDLLRGVEVLFGESGLEKLLAERTLRQIQNYSLRLETLGKSGNWREKVALLAQFRNQEGYMAEMIELSDRSVLLVENHCPISSAAKNCNLLCRSELEVFKTLLGPAVSVERVEHIMQGDRRCAYRVSGH